MADAIISVVVERAAAIIEEQIQNEVNLVRGVEKKVQSLSSELNIIKTVLDDAESRRFKEQNINDWLSRLEHTSYEMEEVLDEWNYAILKLKMEHESSQKVCSIIPSSCLCLKKVAVRHDIAKKINNVKEQLHQIFEEKDRYNFVISRPTNPSPESWRVQSTSLIDFEEIHGRVIDRNILVSKLMSNPGSQEELGLQILSIVGVGGLGKTTLAQLVYNDSRVKDCFELRIWICVSDPFDEAVIAKGIIESVGMGSSPNTNQLDVLCKHLIEAISGKKFLLVLDDVWTEDYNKWKPLKNSLTCGGAGSTILVTTRNERVAEVMGTTKDDIHHLGQLSDEDCWFLLRRIALFGRNQEECEKLQGIGKNIAKKCKGLPLAAKVLGSLLRFKVTMEEWENVLNSEIWEMKEAKVELFPHLLLSYNELSPAVKRCFSYCAVFPKDTVIVVENLIRNWMALGYLDSNIGNSGDMELRGRECFDILAKRSLFQDFQQEYLDEQIELCKMHDIVHDFTQFLRKNGRVEAVGMKKTSCLVCNPLLVSRVKEYRSLFWDKELPPPNLCDCLTSLRVLRLASCNLKCIPLGMENLIHLRWLDLSDNKLSRGDTKTICKLYFLQFLELSLCDLQEIPREIGNLIHLRHLDLSRNEYLSELPENICDLDELRTLNIDGCHYLSGLPQGIHRLINLKHLCNWHAYSLTQYPQGLAQLTGLRTLTEFRGGSGRGKLGWLKNLNHLTGSLKLYVKLADDDLEEVVKDAREAELRRKIQIQELVIQFHSIRMVERETRSVWMDVIDALEPHPNLLKLIIEEYEGSKLPGSITSPLNQLRYIKLKNFDHLSLLPPLGKLPCLEEIYIWIMEELQFVGREFLGITTTTIGGDMDIESVSSSSSAATNSTTISFPKLKKLTFCGCSKWKEWEDITAEEEESAAVSIMPCLTELTIQSCKDLTALPHRLLSKASSLERLHIHDSMQLQQRYRHGFAWKSISQNPRFQLNYLLPRHFN